MTPSYRVEITPAARKALAATPRNVQRRLDAAILTLAETPRPPRAVKLSGSEALYRVRVGDYRVIYEVRDEMLLVIVVRVAHRREVYRKLPG